MGAVSAVATHLAVGVRAVLLIHGGDHEGVGVTQAAVRLQVMPADLHRCLQRSSVRAFAVRRQAWVLLDALQHQKHGGSSWQQEGSCCTARGFPS